MTVLERVPWFSPFQIWSRTLFSCSPLNEHYSTRRHPNQRKRGLTSKTQEARDTGNQMKSTEGVMGRDEEMESIKSLSLFMPFTLFLFVRSLNRVTRALSCLSIELVMQLFHACFPCILLYQKAFLSLCAYHFQMFKSNVTFLFFLMQVLIFKHCNFKTPFVWNLCWILIV